MHCGCFLRGMALGLLVGAVGVILMPYRKQYGMQRQMKRTLRDIEDAMGQAVENIERAVGN